MLDTENYVPRLRADYNGRIKAAMKEEFGYKKSKEPFGSLPTLFRTMITVVPKLWIRLVPVQCTLLTVRTCHCFLAKYERGFQLFEHQNSQEDVQEQLRPL